MKISRGMYIQLAIFLFALILSPALRGQELPRKTPVWGVKSNVLYDAAASINLGVELKIAKKMTLDLPVSYNPFTFSQNKKWKHILVQPELKWWLCEPFSGHFFGIHAHYAYYNVGAIGSNWMKQYRFEGWLAGAGLSYGYQFYLGPRWSLETSIGIGYAHLKYNQYRCENCGDHIAKENKNYFGATKAAVSLIYIIK